MNKIILSGSLTKDSELMYSTSGTPICKFSIAVNEYVKGEQKVQYFNIVSFSAEKLSAYLIKGTKVLIEGKLQNSEYEKEGIKRYRTDVVASSYGGIELLGSKKDNATAQPESLQDRFGDELQVVEDSGDMPF